jgi:F-type H+-transporting ATPase subunit a
MILNYNVFFSPLEQFDAVTWIIRNFIYESNVHAKQYILKGYTEVLATESDSIDIVFLVLFFYLAIATLDILIQNKTSISNFISDIHGDLSIVFFLIFFYFITGGIFTFWFADWIFEAFVPDEFTTAYGDSNTYDVVKNHVFSRKKAYYPVLHSIYWVPTTITYVPQLNVALLLDENLISFLAAFLLFSGAEENEDEDFILEEEESDFIGDIVAPLFIANLGKNVEDNGALFLKICGIFGFIFINNIMGMLPYSDTGTSSLLLTFWVALSVFVSLLTLMLTKHGVNYLFNLFLPEGTPLAIIFLLIPIEFISYTFRLLSLSVRLFANMMAGHTLLKVIVGFSWSMILMGDFFLIANLFPVGILFLLTFLELGVALIQTYVFTILTCMYLKDIFQGH